MKDKEKIKEYSAWILTLLAAALILLLGNRWAMKNTVLFRDGNRTEYAKVVSVEEQKEKIAKEKNLPQTIVFWATLRNSGEKVQAEQFIDRNYGSGAMMKVVAAGDRVVLSQGEESSPGTRTWHFENYNRMDVLCLFLGGLVLLVLLLGRRHGVNILLSLFFTFGLIFRVFIPAILSGCNIYISTLVTCVFIITISLLLINGPKQKTLPTLLGCLAGTSFAAVTTVLMQKALGLTGFVDENSLYLQQINPQKPLDLTGIVFASVLIGVLGAVMDVAMDISSSLKEVSNHAHHVTQKQLWQSGMSIGRDIVGTMANTLILAYVGSSLSGILLMVVYSGSVTQLLNREMVIVEILEALLGSATIFVTIPVTVFICSLVYRGKPSQAEQTAAWIRKRNR